MTSTRLAILIAVFLLASAHSQRAPVSHEAAISPAVLRIKAMQNQIEKQQTEINTLRFRLEKLQQDFQELAEMVADQSTEAGDDDLTDDADVAALVISHRPKSTNRHSARSARARAASYSKQMPSGGQSHGTH